MAPEPDRPALREREVADGNGTNLASGVPTPEATNGATAVASPPLPPRKHRLFLRTFDSLGDRAFRWYFYSMCGWFAAMNMQMVVRGWLVFNLTGSYAALGLVSLANAIPGLLLSLPGGVIADKVMKKHAVQVGQVLNMATAFALAGLMIGGLIEFWHLLLGAVAQGGINAIIMPSRQSMIPEFIEDERLMNAIALNTAAVNVMRLIAPAFGGLMLAITGPGWVYLVIASLYLWSGVTLGPVPGKKPAATVQQTIPGAVRDGLREIVLGLRYIRGQRVVLLVLSLNLAIVLFSQPYQMLLPGFATDVLDAGPGRLGILMSATGVGALVGSLLIASMPSRKRGLILMISALVMGAALIAFSVSTWYWVTLPIMLVIGFGQSGRMSLGSVLLQSYTEPTYRGRVMSIYMLEFSLMAFMVFVVGFVANFLGIQLALGVSSAILITIVLGAIILSPRARNLD